MRSAFALGLFLTACSSLPEPTPPPQGAYGYARQDGQTESTGIANLTIVAVTAFNTVGLEVTDSMPTAVTDANGNFTLPIDPASFPARYALCFVDGSNAVKCDCNFVMQNPGDQFYRYFLREDSRGTPGSWQGQWYGHDQKSSCMTLMN